VIDEILKHGLVEDFFDEDRTQFSAPRPRKPDFPPKPSNPLASGEGPKPARLPPEPVIGPVPDASYRFLGLSLGPVNALITRLRRARAKRKCKDRHKHWEEAARRVREDNSKARAHYEQEVKSSRQYEEYLAADAYWLEQAAALDREYEACMNRWYAHRHYFDEAKRQEREYIASIKAAVGHGQAEAIEYVVALALETAQLPWSLDARNTVHYDPESRALSLDHYLPDLEGVELAGSSAEGSDQVSQEERAQELRDRVRHAITISVLAGIARLLRMSPVERIALNAVSERTGVILSVVAPIQVLLTMDTAQIDTAAAFRDLRAISAETLALAADRAQGSRQTSTRERTKAA
jgi:hypothetical protein